MLSLGLDIPAAHASQTAERRIPPPVSRHGASCGGFGEKPYAGNTAEDPHAGVEWSRGVLDMAEAMQENRPQRITGAQAAHVVDIVCGIQTAFREGRRVEITSEFPQPAPMEWAE
ncbi:MAG: hypothetical protein ACJ797_07905 [Ktedonobacteraceae bacterium]